MLTRRSFKTTLCIVAALAIGLGLIAAFQVDDAAATHSSWLCIFRQHSSAGTTTYTSTETVRTVKTKMNCANCTGQAAKNHERKEKQTYSIVAEIWRHKAISGSTWSSCHNHELSKTPVGSSWWVTVLCGG